MPSPSVDQSDCAYSDDQEPCLRLNARTLSKTSWLAKRPRTKRKRTNDEHPIESLDCDPKCCRPGEVALFSFWRRYSRYFNRNRDQTRSPKVHGFTAFLITTFLAINNFSHTWMSGIRQRLPQDAVELFSRPRFDEASLTNMVIVQLPTPRQQSRTNDKHRNMPRKRLHNGFPSTHEHMKQTRKPPIGWDGFVSKLFEQGLTSTWCTRSKQHC
jgi:hypothetical protein